ncbi:hypothetical protein ACFE04_021636 [Oxalis oulophora]
MKESAINLDDILEDGLEMPQRYRSFTQWFKKTDVKRPLVFESDDEQDEPQPKKLTREATIAHGDQSSVLGEMSITYEDIDLFWERYYLWDKYCKNNGRWSNKKEEDEEICDEGSNIKCPHLFT